MKKNTYTFRNLVGIVLILLAVLVVIFLASLVIGPSDYSSEIYDESDIESFQERPMDDR